MIRWCMYCQALLGERPPYADPTFTHGICEPCDERLEREEPLEEVTEQVRALFRQLLESASTGDEAACAGLLAEANTLGLADDSILVGLLQPALYRAGLEWQNGRMSVAAEHRLTNWCERAFLMLSPAARRPKLDLLIFQTPGDLHTIGPRFAARALSARGHSVEAIVPSVPFEEMAQLAQELRPSALGLSCAMPSSVPVAIELITRLRARLEPTLTPRYLLGGFAFRGGGTLVPPEGIEVVLDLESLTNV